MAPRKKEDTVHHEHRDLEKTGIYITTLRGNCRESNSLRLITWPQVQSVYTHTHTHKRKKTRTFVLQK